MKKNVQTPLTDEYLEMASHLPEVETDAFFYTRLKGKMERTNLSTGWKFSLRPILLIGVLALLLCLNGFFFINQEKSQPDTSGTPSLQTFASSYDLTISTPY